MASELTWEDVCERLWGQDWIAPLSEVLHVNRRTVERWRSGKVEIPDDVERMIVEASPRPMLTRELGDMLRRVANGATDRDLKKHLDDQGAAYRRILGMRQNGTTLLKVASLFEGEEREEG